MHGQTGGLVAVAVIDMPVVSVHIVADELVQVDMDRSPAGAEALQLNNLDDFSQSILDAG